MKLTRQQICARHREKNRANVTRYYVGSLLCSACGELKAVTDFNKDTGDKRGFRRNCKVCQHKADRARYRRNRPAELLYRHNYRLRYPDRVREQKRRAKLKRRRLDPTYRLENSLRGRLRDVLKGRVKSAATKTMLGCSIEFLTAHLEARFQPGMTWANYGSYWVVDHIVPCARFDLTNEAQQRQCFAWTNLQPLTKPANLSKGANLA